MLKTNVIKTIGISNIPSTIIQISSFRSMSRFPHRSRVSRVAVARHDQPPCPLSYRRYTTLFDNTSKKRNRKKERKRGREKGERKRVSKRSPAYKLILFAGAASRLGRQLACPAWPATEKPAWTRVHKGVCRVLWKQSAGCRETRIWMHKQRS